MPGRYFTVFTSEVGDPAPRHPMNAICIESMQLQPRRTEFQEANLWHRTTAESRRLCPIERLLPASLEPSMTLFFFVALADTGYLVRCVVWSRLLPGGGSLTKRGPRTWAWGVFTCGAKKDARCLFGAGQRVRLIRTARPCYTLKL